MNTWIQNKINYSQNLYMKQGINPEATCTNQLGTKWIIVLFKSAMCTCVHTQKKNAHSEYIHVYSILLEETAILNPTV